MSTGAPAQRAGPALVAGELRGYRQFELRADGLYPLVQSSSGPWDGRLERAGCAEGAGHAPPATGCGCGLYAWYAPGSGMVAVGPANAVIAARGRCVLADRGFRAAEARIVAVALPLPLRWNPRAVARARRMLAARYPDTRVYRSARRMVRELPPDDVRALGIEPARDRTGVYRRAAAATYATGLLLTLFIASLPLLVVAHRLESWWLLGLVLFAVAWHVELVWLLARLIRTEARRGRPRPG